MIPALGYPIEHLGVAVADEAAAVARYTQFFGSGPYKEEVVEREGVKTIFFQAGPNKIELLVATRPDSPVAKFIEKRGEGLHHVAFAVGDIRAEMARLRAQGFELLADAPKPGADGKEIVFLHPRSTGGVLVELCADRAA